MKKYKAPDLFKKDIKLVEKQIMALAVPAALNKTAGKANTLTKRGIAGQLGIAQKHFKHRVRFFRASKRKWVVKGWAGFKTKIPVSKIMTDAKGKRYATTKLGIDSNRLFVAKMPQGHAGIYYRKTKKRFPIQEVQIDISEPVKQHLPRNYKEKFKTEFRKLFAHEMQWRLNKKYGSR